MSPQSIDNGFACSQKSQRLFDDQSSWTHEPLVAFQGLLGSDTFVALGRRDLIGRAQFGPNPTQSSHPSALSDKSAKVYTAMFGSYLKYLDSIQVSLPNASAAQIAHFIESKHRTSGVSQRYLRMLERVYQHLLNQNIVTHNCASSAAPLLLSNLHHTSTKELPTTFVDSNAHNASLEIVLRNMLHAQDWRNVRDAAMAAVLIGAGLKVYELSNMRTSWITGTHPHMSIEVPPVGVSRPHRVPLPTLAADALKAWLDRRELLGFVQPLVFVNSKAEGFLPFAPSTSAFEGGAKQSAGLDKSTIYRRMKAIMTEAGIELPRMGGRTLRNTYAVTELVAGKSQEMVEERLGLRERKSLKRYLNAAAHKNNGLSIVETCTSFV